MVERLEAAGLGYHVGAKQTYEKIGETDFLLFFMSIVMVQGVQRTFRTLKKP